MSAVSELTLRQKATYSVHLLKALTKNHQKALRPIMREYIKDDAVIFDIGANAGNFTHIFSNMAPQGQVYAFEPGSYALSILHKVIKMRCQKNVKLFEHGLSDKEEILELRLPVKKSGSLGHGLAHIGTPDMHNSREVKVENIPLRLMDDVATEQKLARLDFLKIDVEGWELHALKGGEKTLKKFKPVIMLEASEVFLKRAGSSKDMLFTFLRDIGYKKFLLLNEAEGTQKHLTHAIEDGNILCLADH